MSSDGAVAAAVKSEWIECEFESALPQRPAPDALDVDVHFSDPRGRTWRVPAYWAGGRAWRVRFRPPTDEPYTFVTRCSDSMDQGLHGRTGSVQGTFDRSRRLRVGERGLVRENGEPFFWLGDTWWMMLCDRLEPEGLHRLIEDRVRKGFTLVQCVAGLFPDMGPRDPRGALEGQFPWEEGFERINPAYYDAADQRIGLLVEQGLVPCIVGAWGYYLKWMGVEKMKRHWRYLVARYAAWPVVWCIAGESLMPWYLDNPKSIDRNAVRQGWNAVAWYVRQIDPYQNPMTTHTQGAAWSSRELGLDVPVDLEMAQGAHGDYPFALRSAATVLSAVEGSNRPVVLGEASYEGIRGGDDRCQRLLFWACRLGGAAGWTYGANGIWQVNGPGAPFGASPHGASWGDIPWEEAMRAPGGMQVAIGRRILEELPWPEMKPHPSWVNRPAAVSHPQRAYVAGIPGQLRLMYVPGPLRPSAWARWRWRRNWKGLFMRELETEVAYRAAWINPIDGVRQEIEIVRGDSQGEWAIPMPATPKDWLLVLEVEEVPVVSAGPE